MKVLEEFIAEIKKFGTCKAADKAGLRRGTVQKWCNGKAIPTLVNAQKVANAIG